MKALQGDFSDRRNDKVYLLVYRTTNTLTCKKKLYPTYAAWLHYCSIQLPGHSLCLRKHLCGCVENWIGKVNQFLEINLVWVEEMLTQRGFLVRFVAQLLVPARVGKVCGQEQWRKRGWFVWLFPPPPPPSAALPSYTGLLFVKLLEHLFSY